MLTILKTLFNQVEKKEKLTKHRSDKNEQNI
jgi:hypothetical protein